MYNRPSFLYNTYLHAHPVHIQVHTHIYVYTYIHTHTYVHIHVYMCVYAGTRINVNRCVRAACLATESGKWCWIWRAGHRCMVSVTFPTTNWTLLTPALKNAASQPDGRHCWEGALLGVQTGKQRTEEQLPSVRKAAWHMLSTNYAPTLPLLPTVYQPI